MASHPPVVTDTAFDCPFCGAYTTQTWRKAYSLTIAEEDRRTPIFWSAGARADIEKDANIPADYKKNLFEDIDRNLSGKVHLEVQSKSPYIRELADNLHLSTCFNCAETAVWVHKRMVFPESRAGEPANADLSEDIKRDIDEARSILNASPRGAAALARLAVQKLCKQLGEPGKNINDDIASLVKKGLDPRLQMALDVVRVVGNDAVHPGEIDLRDDPEIAQQLLQLINAIADQMLTHPKTVQTLYNQLPSSKVAAIAQRDSPKPGSAPAAAPSAAGSKT